MWVDSESVVQYFSVPFGHGIIFAMFVATEKSARDANDFGGHRGEGHAAAEERTDPTDQTRGTALNSRVKRETAR